MHSLYYVSILPFVKIPLSFKHQRMASEIYVFQQIITIFPKGALIM